MTAKKTDWKKERASLQDDEYPDKGKVILEMGARTSKGNDGIYHGKQDMDDLLQILEANRKMYQDLRKLKAKKKMPFKGLFGGGE